MIITRKEILKAIRTENLRAGSPIELRWDARGLDLIEDEKCKVCAVGAVFRQIGIKSTNIESCFRSVVMLTTSNASEDGNQAQELRLKNYLAALSIKFEKLATSYGCGKKTRTKLAEFVKVNFPEEIRVRIPAWAK